MLLELLANDVGPPVPSVLKIVSAIVLGSFSQSFGAGSLARSCELNSVDHASRMPSTVIASSSAVSSPGLRRQCSTKVSASGLSGRLSVFERFGALVADCGAGALTSAPASARPSRLWPSASPAPSSISLGASVTVTDSAALLARWRATRSRVLALISLTDFLPVPIANSS